MSSEGTKSYMIGCHQFFFHPLWVLMAWRLEYKSWPKWWEIICIFLHDVGVCGRQYLSDDEAKKGHWKKGAYLAAVVMIHMGRDVDLISDAINLCAGHCPRESFRKESKLFRADKRARVVAPMWMMWLEYWIEIKKTGALTPPEWKDLIRAKLKSKKTFHAHELFLEGTKSLVGDHGVEKKMKYGEID